MTQVDSHFSNRNEKLLTTTIWSLETVVPNNIIRFYNVKQRKMNLMNEFAECYLYDEDNAYYTCTF